MTVPLKDLLNHTNNCQKLRYIYGPVSSFRLGASLGVDILSQEEKICTYNCIYCQLGETRKYTLKRKVYVEEEEIVKELMNLPKTKIDYITLSGSGEPSLAENLKSCIIAIKGLKMAKIAVLTNSSLINNPEVRRGLFSADLVSLKLDAPSSESFIKINRPAPEIKWKDILEGIFKFRKEYKGKFALQIMLMQENIDFIGEIKRLVFEIMPDCVHLNTPIRPSPIMPLPKDIIMKVKREFFPINTLTVYDKRESVVPFNKVNTAKRRGEIFSRCDLVE